VINDAFLKNTQAFPFIGILKYIQKKFKQNQKVSHLIKIIITREILHGNLLGLKPS